MRIVAVVPNSAVRDVRVMKEARSLKNAGHEVKIIGLQEGVGKSYRTISPDEIDVFRAPVLDTQSEIVSKIRRGIKIFGVFSLLLYAIVAIWLARLGANIVGPALSDSSSVIHCGIWLFFVAIFCGPTFFLGLRLLKRKKKGGEFAATLRSWFSIQLSFFARRRAMRREILPLIVNLKPDLIYCHECMALEPCVLAKKKLKIKLVYDAHEFYDAVEGFNPEALNAYYCKIHRQYLADVDSFVTVSETILECYRETYPELTDNAVVLPNSLVPVTLPDYDGRLHEAANLPREQKILLYQGGISTIRKVDEVVRAAAELPNDWTVVLMGKGAEYDAFKEMANEINSAHLDERILSEMRKQKKLARKKRENGASDPALAGAMVENGGVDYSPAAAPNSKGDVFPYVETQPRVSGDAMQESFSHHSSRGMAVYAAQDASSYSHVGGDAGMEVGNGAELETHREAVSPFAQLRHFVEGRFQESLSTLSKKKGPTVSKSRLSLLESEHRDNVDNILGWELDEFVKVKRGLRVGEVRLAEALAVAEERVSTDIEITDRVVMIDAVPADELLLWTQGATIGVIPYPITSPNHWGCAPNKLWEYPSAGVPIVATPSQEIFSVIKVHGIGWTISADPVAGEFNRLIRHLSDEDIESARNGCADFIKTSNWNTHSEGWLKMVEQQESAHAQR